MGKKKEKKKAKKADKKKKTAACDGLQVCPCCKKHCPLTAPKCGKGRKLAKKLGI